MSISRFNPAPTRGVPHQSADQMHLGVHEILPLKRPGLRGPSATPIGTSFTTGLSPREMMTSSPSQASLINFERLVLASWMVCVFTLANLLS